jgi:hypothetical protein
MPALPSLSDLARVFTGRGPRASVDRAISRPKVILHIGAEKTGTSAIQRFLAENRPALALQGWFYPSVPGGENHEKLTAYAERDERVDGFRTGLGIASTADIAPFRERFEAELLAEIEQNPSRGIIFSNEHCSSRLTTPEEVERLRALIARFSDDVTIVVYLRRQDEFMLSTYSTHIKSGWTGKLALPTGAPVEARYDYEKLLDRWVAAFGREKIVPRVYERTQLEGGDAVTDFLRAAGLEQTADMELPARPNPSLDIRAVEFLRRLNEILPRYIDGKPNPMRAGLVRALEKLSTGPLPTLPDAQLDQFYRSFAASNACVARDYFGRNDGILFKEARAKGNRAPIVPLTEVDLLQIFAALWGTTRQEAAAATSLIEDLRRLANNARRKR